MNQFVFVSDAYFFLNEGKVSRHILNANWDELPGILRVTGIEQIGDAGINWAKTSHFVHDDLVGTQRYQSCCTKGVMRDQNGKVLDQGGGL